MTQESARLERMKRMAVDAVHNALADLLAEAETTEERSAILAAARDSLKPITGR
jgi:hypothetical protein